MPSAASTASRSPARATATRLWRAALPALRGALALVAPVDCAGCGAPDVDLCVSCRDRFAGTLPLVDTLPDGTVCVSGLDYAGAARDAVLAFKNSGRLRLARPLGVPFGRALALLAERVPDDAHPLILLAVPSSRQGRLRRGYDPTRLLVRATGGRAVRGGLEFLRATGQQKTRGRAERLRSRSMRCSPRWSGRSAVIVDDVRTTGATLVEAVRAARGAGVDVVGVAVLAVVPLRARA